jgi:TetR/AcrR family transcriptional repressor of nem operon
LLDVAGRQFIERGYDAVSMRDIADAAGLTKGALYGHFRSKGQLLVEVIRFRIGERDAALDFGEAAADLERGVELMYDANGREIRLLEVDAAAAARHDPDVAAGLAALYRERHDRIRAAMGDVADPDATAWVIGALSAGIGMREATGPRRPANERLGAVLAAALEGLT